MSNSVPKPATDCFVVINYVECEVISLGCCILYVEANINSSVVLWFKLKGES